MKMGKSEEKRCTENSDCRLCSQKFHAPSFSCLLVETTEKRDAHADINKHTYTKMTYYCHMRSSDRKKSSTTRPRTSTTNFVPSRGQRTGEKQRK